MYPKEHFDQIVADYQSGKKLQQIADELKTAHATIRCHLIKAGIKLRAKGRPPLPINTRFWNCVNKTPGCWYWTGYTNKKGYGVLTVYGLVNGHVITTHRLSWELHFGKIPKGLCVCHRCDVPSCVNPDHLFLGTNADNTADMYAKGRNHNISGEKIGTAKLTRKEVLEIRALSPTMTYQAIAKHFNISPASVSNIVRYVSWKHV